jgi:hypothetical protein
MSTVQSNKGGALVALAKIVAIAASGSALVVGTVAAHVFAGSFDEQETAPWVSSVYEHTAHMGAQRGVHVQVHAHAHCHPEAARPKDLTRFMWGPSHALRCAQGALRMTCGAC